MKKPELLELRIEGLTSQGDGIAHWGAREVTVAGVVPGDLVEVWVGRRKRKGRHVGRLEQLLDQGIPRVEPRCPHFGVCGGCRWQNIDYQEQLLLKQRMIEDALGQSGVVVETMAAPIASPEVFFYRNKMEFSFGRGFEGELQLGLHVRQRYNRVFNLHSCQLQSELSNRVVRTVRDQAEALQLTVYDLRSHEGLLRFLVIRDTKTRAGMLVNLVVSSYPHDGIDELVCGLLKEVPEITDLVITRHSGKAQVAIGEEEFLVRGEGRLHEECGLLEFEISPQSFFQTNTQQAGRLYSLVSDMFGDEDGADVLDLYCGTGGISLHIAPRVRQVVGVEQVAEAVIDARHNAQRNGIANCEFIAGPAELVLDDLRVQGRKFGVIVVDPPRPGIHKDAMKQILRLRPRVIIYVSCNPYSMAEDLSQLCASLYRVERLQPIDLFPHTPHCEVIARLVRVDGGS
jgi:23S rRNA (uracil1939-C5)-methyltransferase